MGELLTQPQTKAAKEAGELSETAKKRLDKIAIEIRTGRRESIDSAPIRKGTFQESESIEIYSKFRGQEFDKNVIRLENDFLTGEFDLEELNRKGERVRITDIKTRWSVFTFFAHYTGKIAAKEAAQLQVYCMLGDCEKAEIANVLTNNSKDEIERILYYEALKFKDESDPDKIVFEVPTWRKIQILKDHIFDKKTLNEFLNGEHLDEKAKEEYNNFVEIPLDERVIREEFGRDAELEKDIKAACERGIKYLKETWNIHNIKNK